MFLRSALFAASIVFSGFAMSCEKPPLPEMPDPETAVTAQMIKANNEVKAFLSAAEDYLKCVERNTSKHNEMVDEMQVTADQFNAIVRKYKARMDSN